MLTYVDQLHWIHGLQSAFLPLKSFFLLLNYLDTPFFYFLIIPLVWVLTKQKIGFRLFVVVIFSGYINLILKEFYELPRPYMMDPNLLWVKVQGFGFPSGGAQSSLLIALFAYDLLKKKRGRGFVFLYPFFISLSRVVIGAHFFTDVLMGWVIACVLFFFYLKLYIPNEQFFFPVTGKKEVKHVLILFLTIPLFFVSYHVLKIAAFSLGLTLGSFFLPNKEIDRLSLSKKAIIAFFTLVLFVSIALTFQTLFKVDEIVEQIFQNALLGFSLFVSLTISSVVFSKRTVQ